MDERDFVSKKREAWDRLTALIDKANGKGGVRGLSREEILSLGPLYRRASSDLAYARAHAINKDLILHLNGLVGRSHALLYEAETSGNALGSLINFYLYEFPTLLQKRFKFFAAAFVISVLSGVFAYWLVINYPAKIWLFIPESLKESVEVWKAGKVADTAHVEMAAQLMTHNLFVGLIAFAGGVAGGFPSVVAMFGNGAMLGAMAALMTQVHRHNTFWPGILPHGIAELTAIFICGAAGFRIGLSLLMPGPYRRGDAFRIAGIEGIKLVMGTVPLFIFAGVIEGMFSHLPIPPNLRYAFAAVNGVLWYLYLFLPRRVLLRDPNSPQERNSSALGGVLEEPVRNSPTA
ncbi:MAG: putative rane protein [Chthonomonadaceae bacterium]|nr:putative rane protein [Chthonomonadaceae bacterium]